MPTADDYHLRAPEAADCEQLGALHALIWRTTYARIMPADLLDRMDADRMTENWRRVVTTNGDGSTGPRTVIAVAGNDPVAFISVGPARDEDAPAPRQLWALNVHPDHQGTGLAGRLMDQILGPGPAYLWVADGNLRAIAFYNRRGFRLDGTSATDQHDGVLELRMVRPAAPDATAAH